MKLEYNRTVHKALLYPVRGLHKQNRQDILVLSPLYPKIRGYIVNVFFPSGRAETPKKEIFNKIQHLFYELGAMFSRLQLPQRCTFQKIELVIKMSEQFLDYAGRILEAKSFRFLLV